MAAKDPTKVLAVHVVGISGRDYRGCGKSCLCRQFVHNEYVEETCSGLLQSEFDGCVINQQHAVYWGQKEKTYVSNKATNSNPFVAKLNFEVFEHTVFYQDGINKPFRGHENYEKRIFAPLKSFLNKYAYKFRDDILNPEEYGSKRFSYSLTPPVAYVYVVDVSVSCSVFEEQMKLMSRIVKSINEKKHRCVVVASKFDIHCKENLQCLESVANKLRVKVIQCSAKYDTNIDTAFQYLAVKALSLKKINVKILSHTEAAIQKRTLSTNNKKEDVNIDTIPHISMAENALDMSQCSTTYEEPPAELICEQTYIPQDDSDDSFESDDDDQEYYQMPSYTEAVQSSNSVIPQASLSSFTISHSGVLQSAVGKSESAELLTLVNSKLPLPLLPANSTVQGDQRNLKIPSMPSLHLPIENAFDKSMPSSSASVAESIAPTFTTDVMKDMQDELQDDNSSCSSSWYKEDIKFAKAAICDKETATDTKAFKKQDICNYEESSSSSDGFEKIDLGLPDTFNSQLPVTSSTPNNSNGINLAQGNLASASTVAVLNNGLPSGDRVVQSKVNEASKQELTGLQLSQSLTQSEETSYDDTRSLKMKSVVASEEDYHCDIPECVYIFMHKRKVQTSNKDSEIYTYDYAYNSYVEMCKHKGRFSGVPPRNIERQGFQPSLYVNVETIKQHKTYVNIRNTEQQTISLIPPRGNQKGTPKPVPRPRSNFRPVLPSRDLPRPKCYLSAPAAKPTTK